MKATAFDDGVMAMLGAASHYLSLQRKSWVAGKSPVMTQAANRYDYQSDTHGVMPARLSETALEASILKKTVKPMPERLHRPRDARSSRRLAALRHRSPASRTMLRGPA